MASASVKMPRRRVRVFPGFFALSVGWWGPACPDLLTTNAHTSERNLFGQVRFSELEWWHLGAAHSRGLRSFTLELNLSNSRTHSGLSGVTRWTEELKLSWNQNECKPLVRSTHTPDNACS